MSNSSKQPTGESGALEDAERGFDPLATAGPAVKEAGHPQNEAEEQQEQANGGQLNLQETEDVQAGDVEGIESQESHESHESGSASSKPDGENVYGGNPSHFAARDDNKRGRIELNLSSSALDNVISISKHYGVPEVLVKSIFGLNGNRRNPKSTSNFYSGKEETRKFILNLEGEIITFITNSRMASWKMRPLNSYYRLLSHQLAEYYQLGHIISNTDFSMVLFKINTSLINADVETKKNAKFDKSGNIRPLNYKNLTFDPNEKLNRVKLSDLYFMYKQFFDEIERLESPEKDLENNFDDLHINESANPGLQKQRSNIKILQREDVLQNGSQLHSDPESPSFPETQVSREGQYNRLNEQEVSSTGTSNSNDDAETQIIVGPTEKNTLGAEPLDYSPSFQTTSGNWKPQNNNHYHKNANRGGRNNGANNYNGNYRRNQRFSNNKNHGYNDHYNSHSNYNYGSSQGYNNRNENDRQNGNSYPYQYNYYPPNQMYQMNGVQPKYMVAPATAPGTIPVIPSPMGTANAPSAGYYYVPVMHTSNETDVNGEEHKGEVDKVSPIKDKFDPPPFFPTPIIPISPSLPIAVPMGAQGSNSPPSETPVPQQYPFFYPAPNTAVSVASAAPFYPVPSPSTGNGMYMPMMYYKGESSGYVAQGNGGGRGNRGRNRTNSKEDTDASFNNWNNSSYENTPGNYSGPRKGSGHSGKLARRPSRSYQRKSLGKEVESVPYNIEAGAKMVGTENE